MPIKPENKKLYPTDWKEIRAEILERAGNRCEFCGVENNSIGYRDGDKFYELPNSHQSDLDSEDNRWKIIKIVLTIAHLDHNPENNGVKGRRRNLAALCQKCHLTYDARHHAKNARKTRDTKTGKIEMEF